MAQAGTGWGWVGAGVSGAGAADVAHHLRRADAGAALWHAGGAPGLPFRLTLERDGVVSALPGKANLELREGDLVTLESCGGGGWG